MSATIETPVDLLEQMGELRFPPRTDARLQTLMDRNSAGALSPDERVELESLVELSEKLSLVRARCLRLLGRSPQ